MKSRLFSPCFRYRGGVPFLVLAITGGSLLAEPVTPWKRHAIDPSDQAAHLSGADGVKSGDLNGDGFADFVTGWEEGGKVRICLHPGRDGVRDPWPSITVGRVPGPEDAVFADLDGDGRLDVVSACEGKGRSLNVHWAPGKGSDILEESLWTTARFPLPGPAQWWMQVLPRDVDLDGDTDLIAGSKNEGASVTWLENPGPGSARLLESWRSHRIADAGWIMTLALARMGGKDCLVYSDRKGKGSGIWISSFLPEAPWISPPFPVAAVGEEVMFLDLADTDGDSTPEILAAIRPATIRVYSLDEGADPASAGWILRHEMEPLPWDRFGTVKALRWNGGSGLLAVSCENATEDRCGLLLATLSSEWMEIGGSEGVKFDLVDWIDLDGDGDSDLVTCEERAGLGVIWYENPGKGAGEAH